MKFSLTDYPHPHPYPHHSPCVGEIADDKKNVLQELSELKNKIGVFKSSIWKHSRWYVNPYDFKLRQHSVVINRAFYKYWEIQHEFNLLDSFDVQKDFVFCGAEAPGGFIQAIIESLKKREIDNGLLNKKEVLSDDDGFTLVTRKRPKKILRNNFIYTMSLRKTNKPTPSYDYRISESKHVTIIDGITKTGDLTCQNIQTMYKLKGSVQVITADGGVDEGVDYNDKENIHHYLILKELYSALYLQKIGGNFVLKVFDTVTMSSVHLLYFLTKCYKQVVLFKPKTTRPTNSEKYVVCKDFQVSDTDRQHLLNEIKAKIEFANKECEKPFKYTLTKDPVPQSFIDMCINANVIYMNSQYRVLKKAIEICKKIQGNKKVVSSISYKEIAFKRWIEAYKLPTALFPNDTTVYTDETY